MTPKPLLTWERRVTRARLATAFVDVLSAIGMIGVVHLAAAAVFDGLSTWGFVVVAAAALAAWTVVRRVLKGWIGNVTDSVGLDEVVDVKRKMDKTRRDLDRALAQKCPQDHLDTQTQLNVSLSRLEDIRGVLDGRPGAHNHEDLRGQNEKVRKILDKPKPGRIRRP